MTQRENCNTESGLSESSRRAIAQFARTLYLSEALSDLTLRNIDSPTDGRDREFAVEFSVGSL